MIETIVGSFIGTLLALTVFAVPISVIVKRKIKNFNPLGGFND